MVDDETTKLQNEDEWDFESGEVQRAPRGRRSIVSVGFKPDEFQLVAEAAGKHNQPVSQFIRTAAIDRARSQTHGATQYVYLETTIIPADVAAELQRVMSLRHGRMPKAS